MRICRMLGWEGDVSLAGDNGQTLARVCRGLSVGRRLCCAPSTLPGLVPISPSEGTRWGHDGDRRSCHGFWPPITSTGGQEGEGIPPAGVPRSGGDAEGPRGAAAAAASTPAPCLLWEDSAARLKGDAGGCCWVRSSTHGLSAAGSLPSPPAAGGSPHVALWGRWAGCPGCLSHAPAAVGPGRAGAELSSSWASWCPGGPGGPGGPVCPTPPDLLQLEA